MKINQALEIDTKAFSRCCEREMKKRGLEKLKELSVAAGLSENAIRMVIVRGRMSNKTAEKLQTVGVQKKEYELERQYTLDDLQPEKKKEIIEIKNSGESLIIDLNGTKVIADKYTSVMLTLLDGTVLRFKGGK